MPKFTKQQKEAAAEFLRNPQGSEAGTSSTEDLERHSNHLLEVYKARVVTGETLSPVDLHNVKLHLTASDQSELRTFLGED
jgi:hypothetical protein